MSWYKAHPEKRAEAQRKWRAKNPKLRRALQRAYELRHPEKYKARIAICNAVKRGRIKKPTSCDDCGKKADRIEAHHSDYSKKLDVKWLCILCHTARHKNGMR